ncbi:hypothetical protein ACFQY4_25575 [Catellatospora bangladeshensis]|uniref:Uncharacterized protein n=1 Tax=Catellatospora bangladeshensis TaxID=310355 RepID=A0A8J3NHP2_9ACTN|nr:hypothetical protein [Catellatospora bangladeshensis]GIF81595.1 hypothetical protein Cba03nite_29440 [Catellatospora bangladeshensis]
MLDNRAAVPICLPLALRRHPCAAERRPAGVIFRVDIDHELRDAWLLALCTARADTAEPTVVERMTVRLRTTRGVGPDTWRRRSDSRAARGSGRAMPHSPRLELARRLTRRHRRIGPL